MDEATQKRANAVIEACQRSLGRTLSRGQRIDLLLDQSVVASVADAIAATDDASYRV